MITKQIRIAKDEAWPVYYITNHGKPSSISDKDFRFIQKAEKDYDKAQEILRKAYYQNVN